MKKSIRHELVVELPDSFLRKLIHLGLLDKWLDNTTNKRLAKIINSITLIRKIQETKESKAYNDADFLHTFYYSMTPEGNNFWRSIQYEIEHWDKYHKK